MSMIDIEKFISFAKENNIPYKTDAIMKDYTTFKIGGPVSFMFIPDNDEQVCLIVKECKVSGIKPFILGNGSNMLISDKGLDTVVINMSKEKPEIRLIDDTTIECDAGILMVKVCNFALKNSLTGLEFAFGIPGSAGGAAYMNAGAYGGEMKDVLVSCVHIDDDGNIGKLSNEELGLAYRTSAYEKNGYIITKLIIRLKKGNPDEIKAKMNELMQKRKDKQPLEYPSAGSTFKRPEGYFAGTLIEECGLKGTSVGGAQVSRKHAGFVINTGDATSGDVMELIRLVQAEVFNKKGVMLEPEVRLIEK